MSKRLQKYLARGLPHPRHDINVGFLFAKSSPRPLALDPPAPRTHTSSVSKQRSRFKLQAAGRREPRSHSTPPALASSQPRSPWPFPFSRTRHDSGLTDPFLDALSEFPEVLIVADGQQYGDCGRE